MDLAHFVYIPGTLLVGVVIGYVLKGRAAEAERADRERARERISARRAAKGSSDTPS